MLTVAAVSVTSYRQNTEGLRAAVTDRLDGIANRRVADVNRWVRDELATLDFVASVPQVGDDVAALLRARPDSLVRRERIVRLLRSAGMVGIGAVEMFVLSPRGGRVIASTDTTQIGTYHVNELYFVRGQEGPFVQDVYPSSRTGRPALTVATPVKADSGAGPPAVLVAHLDLHRMEELVVQSSGPLPVEVYLVNRFSEFVTADRFGRADFRRGVRTVGIDSALARRNGRGVYLNYAGVPVIGAWRWMEERQLALLVESPQHAAFTPARRTLASTLVTGLAAIVILTLGIFWVTRRVVGPILDVARAAEAVAAGQFETTAPVQTDDEVGVLATSFNAMTSRLRDLYADLNDQVAATSRMVDALQKNQALVQGIVDNSAAVIGVIGFNDQVMLVNRRLRELSYEGRPASAGMRLSDILDPDNVRLMRAAVQLVRTTRSAVEREMQVETGTGVRTFFAVCFPIADDSGVPYAVGVIATDHTERKRVEEEHRALEAQVRHTQKLESLGVMAGGIAHDFNNILGGVLGHAELALDSLPQGAQARTSIEQVLAATRRASDLTRQMLAYAGKASFGKEVIGLNTVVREISELATVTVSKKIRVVHEFTTSPTWFLADGAQVSQIVLNLMTNAADAIGDRDGQINVSTSVSDWTATQLAESYSAYSLPSGRYLQLSVSDTGSGMSPQTLSRIFDPFFTTKSSGRGLGLAAVLGIVRSSGGGLSVTSAPGKGTRFDVIFPAVDAPEGRPADERGPVPVHNERRTVLVADDEEMLRTISTVVLRKAGFDVLSVGDGLEAVRVFAANRARLSAIVLDMTMPGMSGQEVLAAIRRDNSTVPVVLSSGYDSADSAATLAADPFVQFLQKPYTPTELVRRVSQVVAASMDAGRQPAAVS
jgi:signal transduction histidine kinase/ActR/RegA family two-component response regulator